MATAAPNPLASGDTAYLYRAAIGAQGQDYYLRHFARFDGEGKTGTHLKVTSLDDLPRAAVKAWLKTAATRARA